MEKRNWKNRNWMLKTLCGMLFNLAGAYLLFFPQTYAILFSKIVGVIGLLFSYYIFYADIESEDLRIQAKSRVFSV